MRTTITVLIWVITMLAQVNYVEAQRNRPNTKNRTLSAREVAEKVMPSVVLIVTQDENGDPISQGSGFVYKPGLVVSNLHVFERASNAIVKNVKTGEISKAVEVVGMNARQDICVIRIDTAAWPAASIGDSHSVRTGDDIYVASNPKGLEGSLTKGIISGIREKNRVPKNEHPLDTLARETLDQTVFQIDASISPGSSGGAVLNTLGEVIGIVSSSLVEGQNLNFAVPSEQLIATRFRYSHSVQLAGACAYSDLKKERLKGRVRTIETRELPGMLNSDERKCCELITTSAKTYNLEGMLIESKVFDGTNGRLVITYAYFYDENYIKTMIRTTLADSGKINEIGFDFDNGIFNKLYGKSFSGSVGKIDGDGGMQVFDSDGHVIAWHLKGVKYTYEYDSSGRVEIQTQFRDEVPEIISQYRYINDKHGNWIQKTTRSRYPNTKNINPNIWFPQDHHTEFRTITYHGN